MKQIWLVAVIFAHSWYPLACCEGSHCRPVACEEIQQRGADWVWHGTRFPDRLRQSSSDGGCHVCIADNGVPLCLFLGGMV